MYLYELTQQTTVTLDAAGIPVVQIPLEAWKEFLADNDARQRTVQQVEALLLQVDGLKKQLALLPKKELTDNNQEYQQNSFNDIADSLHTLWTLIDFMRLAAADKPFSEVIARHLRQMSMLPAYLKIICNSLLSGQIGDLAENEAAIVREILNSVGQLSRNLQYLTAEVAPQNIVAQRTYPLVSLTQIVDALPLRYSLTPVQLSALEEIRRIIQSISEQAAQVSALELLSTDFEPAATLIHEQLARIKQEPLPDEAGMVLTVIERDADRIAAWAK